MKNSPRFGTNHWELTQIGWSNFDLGKIQSTRSRNKSLFATRLFSVFTIFQNFMINLQIYWTLAKNLNNFNRFNYNRRSFF
jgi:hypothetical protein